MVGLKVIDPRDERSTNMDKIIRWGILSTGFMATGVTKLLNTIEDASVDAVGSRSIEKAKAFAKMHGLARYYGSYEELAADPNIDVIYVATPEAFHKNDCITCLNAGKAVLCEKPFMMNVAELEEVVELAREKNLFLMEGMWARFFPVMKKVKDWIEQKVIGEIKFIYIDLGLIGEWYPKGRLLNAELGSSALTDVGVYPISIASFLAGAQPEKITSMMHFCDAGVDDKTSMIINYTNNMTAVLSCNIGINTMHEAHIMGTKGNIHIPNSFACATKAVLEIHGQENVEINITPPKGGQYYEVMEVMDCIRKGKLESDFLTIDDSLTVMKIMDEIKHQGDFKFPSEK